MKKVDKMADRGQSLISGRNNSVGAEACVGTFREVALEIHCISYGRCETASSQQWKSLSCSINKTVIYPKPFIKEIPKDELSLVHRDPHIPANTHRVLNPIVDPRFCLL